MDCGLNSKVLLQFRLKYRYRSLVRILVHNVGKFQLEIRSGRRSKRLKDSLCISWQMDGCLLGLRSDF